MTTVTTVGIGDIVPVSETEALYTCILMIAAVTAAVLVTKTIENLYSHYTEHSPLDTRSQSCFFQVLSMINSSEPLCRELETRVSNYLKARSEHDRRS